MPRYGTINGDYIASWFSRDEPGDSMWALNLMKYRERADYADGRETALSGAEADDTYAPHEHLRKVGSRIVLVAPVVHQLVGDQTVWDRIGLVRYRDRMAMVEMSSSPDFAEAEAHKDAGMEFTIVMATFPIEGDPADPQVAEDSADRLLLLQVVDDASRPDMAEDIESTRIARFWVEDRFLGDHRTFAEARYDLISRDTAAELASRDYQHDESNYVVIAEPQVNDLASALSGA